MASNVVYGAVLILVMCAMVWFARPPKGQDLVPWLRNYFVGQIYVIAAMVCGVFGVTMLIQSWP